MQTTVNFRNQDASTHLRQYATDALGKLDRVGNQIETAVVTLTVDGTRHKADIRLSVPGPDLFCSESADTPQAAVDACVESLRRSLVRQKEIARPRDPAKEIW